jgi:transcriptional regulator with XRE-family HTH domain
MSLFSDRLREERKRLKKNQKEFAALLGMPDRTYWDRESGNAVPDAEFLATIREHGVDVWYIITGERMPMGVAQAPVPYSPAEHAAVAIQGLVLTEADAEMVVSVAKRLAQ